MLFIPMNKKIHTVIFDLDGTLCDSAVLTFEAFKRVLPGYALPLPTLDAIRRATGFATPEFFYILFPDHDKELVCKMGIHVEEDEQLLLPSLGSKLLFEGCQDLLIRLKEYGIRLCIASTGANDHVFPVLNATGITGFFDKIFCGQPDKVRMLQEITGDDDKSGYVMVGDMKKDYEAARANGIVSVGACYGYCIKEDSHFNLYIDSALDLLDVLKI